jgi:hypothetical protein
MVCIFSNKEKRRKRRMGRNRLFVLVAMIALLFASLISLARTVNTEQSTATIIGVAFSQFNFYLDGVSTLHSDWGDAHVSFIGSADIEYLNLISNGSWTIQNLPVLSVEGVGVAQEQDFWFQLGVSTGTPVTSITCGIQIVPRTMDTPPTQDTVAPVNGEDYIVNSGGVDVKLPTAVPTAAPIVGGAVADPIQHINPNFPNQACGLGECAPAAVSNSMQWLNDRYNLGIQADQMTIAKMKTATNWGEKLPGVSGCWILPDKGRAEGQQNAWWQDKDLYMKDKAHGMPITTTMVLPKDIGKIAGYIDEHQDVEMTVGGHTVAVVGIADLGGGKYEVTFQHDKTQGVGGVHELVKETAIWDSKTWSGALAGYGFNYFVVECPIKKPVPVPRSPIMDKIQYVFYSPSRPTILAALKESDGLGGLDMAGCSFTIDQLTPYWSDTGLIASAWSGGEYCVYKAGLLGVPDEVRKTNTIKYTGPPASTPVSNIIYYGTNGPPDMVNPIFSNSISDSQVLTEIFTYPLATNQYTTAPGSVITGFPAGGDLPWMAYSWKTELVANPGGVEGAAYPGQWTNVTLWFRHDITWHDGVPFTVADLNYTIYVNALYGDSPNNAVAMLMTNASNNYAPYFQQDGNPYTCSILVSEASWSNLYLTNFGIVPYHLYKYIVPNNITAAELGLSTDGLHGLWPGEAAVAGNLLSGAPFTLSDLNTKPETTLVGTGPWMYEVGSTNAALLTSVGGGITLDAYRNFFLRVAPGAVAFKYTWLNTSPSQQPSGGYFKVGLVDLIYLANAYGTKGTPPSAVPITEVPGASHSWNPAADFAAPSGVVGLSDLITLALHYGWYYGNYSYNAPYPASEVANGGP